MPWCDGEARPPHGRDEMRLGLVVSAAPCRSTAGRTASRECPTGRQISGMRRWDSPRLRPVWRPAPSSHPEHLGALPADTSWHASRLSLSLVPLRTSEIHGASSTQNSPACQITDLEPRPHSPFYLYMAAKRECISRTRRFFRTLIEILLPADAIEKRFLFCSKETCAIGSPAKARARILRD